jgi:hypothetical protein
MQTSGQEDAEQGGASADLVQKVVGTAPLRDGNGSHGCGGEGQGAVLVELLRQIPPVVSEEPEAIMQLFVRLDEIHELGLVDDRTFVARILPLVSGSLLTFIGGWLREGSSWAENKAQLLERYFPYFVRERLVRELIVFNFHGEGQSLRKYIERIFRVAKFLDYQAREEQLVERVIMNFHPSILANATLMDRPRSLQDLYRVVGLIEERLAVVRERRRINEPVRLSTSARGMSREAARSTAGQAGGTASAGRTCWSCGQPGHMARTCPRRQAAPGNGQVPGGQVDPGRTCYQD